MAELTHNVVIRMAVSNVLLFLVGTRSAWGWPSSSPGLLPVSGEAEVPSAALSPSSVSVSDLGSIRSSSELLIMLDCTELTVYHDHFNGLDEGVHGQL